ncbi:unannotated protein [freshwater metagenome]|uniref:Unannotated protein n=1 Tax=freshwater metagenome TaxID=449393 RepID=A0A6J7SJ89_9ZZZZ
MVYLHYFVTGHTGFKGAWLVSLLRHRGHEVSGFALDPEPGSLFEVGNLAELMRLDVRADIRDAAAVASAIGGAAPDVVIHMAAQPLVRESYLDPRYTMETNVNGTLNVLEAVGKTPSVQAHLVVTTDKVYRNVNQIAGYTEDDPLGGSDPYSASKAMADLLVQSWVQSFDGPPTAIARAGNVIGGGDVCKDRLLPDLMRAFAQGTKASIRYPESTRPWQHVLDCLNGYLCLVDHLLASSTNAGAWNFGPQHANFASVSQVCSRVAELWGGDAEIQIDSGNHLHEAALLTLNSNKAREQLDWSEKLDLDQTLSWTVAWTKEFNSGASAAQITHEQIRRFETNNLS